MLGKHTIEVAKRLMETKGAEGKEDHGAEEKGERKRTYKRREEKSIWFAKRSECIDTADSVEERRTS
ncbi:hypothetical protein M0802_005586 [Mischocyttarus mexicanus]|nr:hypothetical protein M0802_005586 [Mischocyttarus mexicanus]